MSQTIAHALFADLRSSDPAIRFSVLSRIENIAWTDDLRVAFAVLAETEQDPGTRFHMRLILARVSPAHARVLPAADLLQQEIARLAGEPGSDPVGFALILDSLSIEQGPVAVMTLKEHGWESYPADLLPFVLRLLGKFGTPDLVPALEALCRHPDPRVLSAAVEALERLAPESLQGLIVPLLNNPNHGIRSRAVRLLYKWDPDEAVRHFQEMLFSDDPQDRHAAMFHAYFFPFDRIEALLVRFLGLEDDAGLLTKAGYLFQVNPAPEPPMALIDVMESCLGPKRALIGGILKGVLEAQGRLLQADPHQLLEKLRTSYRNKKARELLDQCRLQWPAADEVQRQDILGRLEVLNQRGFPAAGALLTVLRGDTTSTAPRAAEEPKPAPEPSPLTGSPPPHPGAGAPTARPLPKKPELGGRNAVASLEAVDPVMVTAAIEALAESNPDQLFPYLPRLIRHSSLEVQIAAIRVYSMYDKKEALRLLDRLLVTPQPATRATALFHLARFDFPSIQGMLLEALGRETDRENLAKIAAILTSNADERLAHDVFRIAQTIDGDRRTDFDRLVEQVCLSVLEQKRTTAPTLLALLDRLREAESERRRQSEAAPDYSVANIRRLRQQQGAGRGTGLAGSDPTAPGAHHRRATTAGGSAESEDEHLWGFALQSFFGMGFLAWLVWVMILSPLLPAGPSGLTPADGSRNAQAQRPGTGEQLLEGRVMAIASDGLIIAPTSGGAAVLVRPRVFPVGSSLKLRIRPLPSATGTAQAELLETY
jgi:HEAT repeat protein